MRWIAPVCALSLFGCAVRGPGYIPAPSPAAADVLVYIYRPDNFALGKRDAYFYVDDVNVADVSANGYTWFHVPAGEYIFQQKWPFDVTLGTRTLTLKVQWLPGRTYFYRLETARHSPKIVWRLSEAPADEANIQIAKCKLQPALGVEKLRERISRKCTACI